jgi:hypothetical protein
MFKPLSKNRMANIDAIDIILPLFDSSWLSYRSSDFDWLLDIKIFLNSFIIKF